MTPDDGHVLSSVYLCVEVAGEGFREMIRRAREEYLQQPSKVQAVRSQDSTTGRTYSLSGAQVPETTRGIVIRDGHKMVR